MNIRSIYIPYKKDQIQADLFDESRSAETDVIIMAHGLGAEKACGLDYFAQFYYDLGYRVCVFDHRGYGASTGPVKHLVDKSSQQQDWITVIDYLNREFNIQHNQMILWGYSFSGGHVLSLAAKIKYKAMISNFPHVDGLASLSLYPKKYLLPATWLALQDLALAPFGKVKTMAVVSPDRFAVLAGEDCYTGYHSIVPEHVHWENAVPARIVASIGLYRPITTAHLIRTPTLVIAAKKDSLIPIQATRKLANTIENAQYLEVDCGHFDLFHAPYQTDILQAHQQFLSSLK